MKKTHFKRLSSIALINLAIAAATFAQTGDRGGNGGDINELSEFTNNQGQHLESWYSVKQDLIKGLEMDQHQALDLGKIDANDFKVKFLQSLQTAKVQWDNKTIVVQGTPRVCENFIDPSKTARIHCNAESYSSAMKNSTAEDQYRFIAHEYLSLAHIEPNQYGISDYSISSQISQKLSRITVKRWAVIKSDRLTMEDLRAKLRKTLYQTAGPIREISGFYKGYCSGYAGSFDFVLDLTSPKGRFYASLDLNYLSDGLLGNVGHVKPPVRFDTFENLTDQQVVDRALSLDRVIPSGKMSYGEYEITLPLMEPNQESNASHMEIGRYKETLYMSMTANSLYPNPFKQSEYFCTAQKLNNYSLEP